MADPLEAVVSIWKDSIGSKGNFIGSGVFIAPQWVLTARHVVDDALSDGKLYLGSVTGKTSVPVDEAEVSRHDDDNIDLTLLKLAVPYDRQSYTMLDYRAVDYENQLADFHAFNRLSLDRETQQSKTIGSYHEDKYGYLCDHQVLKGFSGGIATVNGAVIAIIVERHTSDQQTLILPLHITYKWCAGVLPESVMGRFYLPHSSPVVESSISQTEFAQRVRKQIGQSLAKPRLALLRDVLHEHIQADRSVKPEFLLIPDGTSFDIEASFSLLYDATEDCLQKSVDQNSKDLGYLSEQAKNLLGWLVVLAVSEDWIEQNPQRCNTLLEAQFVEIPLKSEAITEVVVARLRDKPAKLQLEEGGSKVSGVHHISVHALELGLGDEEIGLQIKGLIWQAILKEKPPESFGVSEQEEVNHMLDLAKRRGENYCVMIPKNRSTEFSEVRRVLEKEALALDAFILGTTSDEHILVMPEPRLLVWIRDILRMIREYTGQRS